MRVDIERLRRVARNGWVAGPDVLDLCDEVENTRRALRSLCDGYEWLLDHACEGGTPAQNALHLPIINARALLEADECHGGGTADKENEK